MNPSTAQAQVLVDELVRNGVRHAVLCPGSRNAPLSFALHDASMSGRLTLHVRVDERSAAFLALGLSSAGMPAVLACTSGTAPANFHPAVLEADRSGTSLLVLTADRPPELRAALANQVIDQHRLYGTALRHFDELAVAQRAVAQPLARQNAYWRSQVCRAVHAASPRNRYAAGPVQLNIPFAEPLVPDGTAAEECPATLSGRPHGARWTEVSRRPGYEPAEVTPSGRRGLLLVAGAATESQLAWGARNGWPVIAEAGGVGVGGPAGIACGNWLLGAREFLARHRPDQVVCVGRPTVFRQFGELLTDPEVSVLMVGDDLRWPSPGHNVHQVGQHYGDATEPADADWLPSWQEADRLATSALHRALDEQPWPTGMRLARELVDALPDGALLTVGSSNPTRDVALAARARTGILLQLNRGVSGIDGMLSTAIGASIVHNGPCYALVGDLTFLHDLNGLLIGTHEQWPDLTVVVVNDDGGGIFSLLEQGSEQYASSFERVFGTPHGADLVPLCAGYGVPHRLVTDRADFHAALRPATGVRVIEVRTDRRPLRDSHAAIRTAVHAAVRP